MATDLEPLGPGVFAVRTEHVEGWCGLLVGRRRTLVVDAGKDPAEGRRLARIVQEMGRPADLLVYTHGHWDHVRGGVAFDMAEVVAHRAAVPMTIEELEKARSLDDDPGSQDARVGQPTIAVDGEATFDLGDLVAHLIPAPGHAPGACIVHVPAARALFAGDTVVTAIPPAFADGDSATLESTIRRVGGMDVDVLVPGHGQILRSATAISEWTSWTADYLARVRDHVNGLMGSETVDGIVALTAFAAFVGDRLPADRHDMAVRHERTVRGILAELASGTG
jgi:glyoxylase-like metal-dependent hydrolase (beta-lactamase superfamily II)